MSAHVRKYIVLINHFIYHRDVTLQEHMNHKPCHVVEIVTPKKVVLDGLWVGPKRARNVIILIHGLGSSLWKRLPLAERLAGKGVTVLAFNNRGHDRVSALSRVGTKQAKRKWAGGASEIFTDCVDDIQGAINFVRRQKAKNIFLAGHSTGCQKSIYWAHKKKGKGVKGLILLAPLSDYSVALRDDKGGRLARVTKLARSLVRRGKKHDLLPQSLWPALDDAQRFLSLYTPDSVEEMFTYAQPKKIPRIFSSIRIPTLVIFAGADEFGDRPAREIAAWFHDHSRSQRFDAIIVPKVKHSFRGKEQVVARATRQFLAMR